MHNFVNSNLPVDFSKLSVYTAHIHMYSRRQEKYKFRPYASKLRSTQKAYCIWGLSFGIVLIIISNVVFPLNYFVTNLGSQLLKLQGDNNTPFNYRKECKKGYLIIANSACHRTCIEI